MIRASMIGVGVSILASVVLVTMHGQSEPKFTIAPWAAKEVELVHFDSATDLIFNRLFANPVWTPQLPYAFRLKNHSAHNITAVTLIWNTPGGEDQRSTNFNDSYSRKGLPPLVYASSEAIVVPLGIVSAEVAQQRLGFFSGTNPNLSHASRVEVVLDAVIFDDGRVIGEDHSHTVDYLTGRKLAAESIVATVTPALERHENLDDLLKRLAAVSGDYYDFAANATSNYAGKLRHKDEQNRVNYLAQLAALPELPKFYR